MKKIALITGAGKGIGFALAQKLLQEGFFIIGTCRSGNISGFAHPDFVVLPLDLGERGSILQAHKVIREQFGVLDILINNAGIGPDLDTYQPDETTFAQTFDVNVKGTVFFTEPLIGLIRDEGMILNISSKMGSLDLCALTDSIAYRMSKSALNMYTKILTNRLKGRVKVAAVHPGWVITTLTEGNVHARLTPAESANRIYTFLKGGFASGVFWDAETQRALPW